MKEDKFGEYHPVVQEENCTGCQLCIASCHNNRKFYFNYPKKCYASWISDKKKRCICASGGAASVISEYFIKYKNGIVFGTAYDEKLIPRTTYAETLDKLEKFKGSKYVQSIVDESVFKRMKDYVKDGRYVLYIATPCQIAAAKSYLKKDYENFYTVDLICHGVSPVRYFTDEVQYIIKKLKLSDITDIRFRGNDSNNFRLSIWDNNYVMSMWSRIKKGGGKNIRVYRGSDTTDYYLSGFLMGITLRECCYSCRYARPDRISDITAGDFIGLGEHEEFRYKETNVSAVMINSEKGTDLYDDIIRKMPEYVNVTRNYDERLKYGPSLRYPFPRSPLNAVFRENYLKSGFVRAVRITLKQEMNKRRIHKIFNMWTYIYRVPRKIFRIIAAKNGI